MVHTSITTTHTHSHHSHSTIGLAVQDSMTHSFLPSSLIFTQNSIRLSFMQPADSWNRRAFILLSWPRRFRPCSEKIRENRYYFVDSLQVVKLQSTLASLHPLHLCSFISRMSVDVSIMESFPLDYIDFPHPDFTEWLRYMKKQWDYMASISLVDQHCVRYNILISLLACDLITSCSTIDLGLLLKPIHHLHDNVHVSVWVKVVFVIDCNRQQVADGRHRHWLCSATMID
jgi:hypothetical protein